MDRIWNLLSEKRREIKNLKAGIDVCEDAKRRPIAELRAELERYQDKYKGVIAAIDEAQASMSERNTIVEKVRCSVCWFYIRRSTMIVRMIALIV
ncbi:unnamed protein product [Toxocara canis]|uniref:Tubulin-specific chaperone A n=1 Tax=Toxocara canis TaxID=6265 RepID=A0A183U9K8_TOXCA|nr:unnamed protein product [Toxocara canis]